MRAEHIQRSRVGSCSAALPAWAAGKFTEAQAAAMGPVGLEMLNKRVQTHRRVTAEAREPASRVNTIR